MIQENYALSKAVQALDAIRGRKPIVNASGSTASQDCQDACDASDRSRERRKAMSSDTVRSLPRSSSSDIPSIISTHSFGTQSLLAGLVG